MAQKIMNLKGLGERVAATRIGQYAIEKAEQVLLVLEQTSAWSMQYKNRTDEEPPKRPLPWVFFFALIVALRMSRASLSLLAILMNKSSVTPKKTVYFFKEQRRALKGFRRRVKNAQEGAAALTTYNDTESNCVTQNNVKSNRKSNSGSWHFELPGTALSGEHATEGSDGDDDDYVFRGDESTTEDEELSETEDSTRNISKTNDESEADQHSKAELNNFYDDEETLSAAEGGSEEYTDISRLDSTSSPSQLEQNHISNLQVKLSNSKSSEPPKESEKLPNEGVNAELLVERLSHAIHAYETKDQTSNVNDSDANIDPNLLAHNGGNFDDLSKHFNDILSSKATPDVERTLENRHPFEKHDVHESQDLIHKEKTSESSNRVDLNNQHQTSDKPAKVIRSGHQNPKRSKGATHRQTK